MPGPGGISSNPPVNTGFTPTQGAGQAKAPGMEHIENLVLGGQSRTAQAQPPGKSFIETMGAAFKAMGDVVSNFFKNLGDRIATIEMPSLPRISLRSQAQTQAAQAQTPPPLPEVAVSSLTYLFKVQHLGQDAVPITPHQLNMLNESMMKEHSDENMLFIRSGAALMTIQAADGSTRPVDGSKLKEGESVKLTAELPVIKQWVAQFVGGGAEQQVNLKSTNEQKVRNALAVMPDDLADATDGQIVNLAQAMRGAFVEIVNMVSKDSLPRARNQPGFE